VRAGAGDVVRPRVRVGRADFGAPPMSVPHIDTRYIDGKKYVSEE
jgi:hypothetical protein